MTQQRKTGLLGINIGAPNVESLVDRAMRAINSREEIFTFACANPHSLVIAQSDSAFRSALRSCSAVVADGIGVTLASRIVGQDVGPRITGTDFFERTMQALNRRGGRVFFLGSTDHVLERILERTRHDYPNLYIDTYAPPFGTWTQATNDELVTRIRSARADVLWVGMTAPKQEKWVYANAALCNVPVVGSVGAVFDYYAQTVQRAPRWACALGMEWLYRLAREPRRLWRRTLISGPAFLWLVMEKHIFS